MNFSSKDGILFSKDGTSLLAYPRGKHANTFDIPDGVTEIKKGAFFGCASITAIDLPNSVTEIGGRAFQGCSNLTTIIIPNRVMKISRGTFSECTNLATAIFPNSRTLIEEGAFERCPNLTIVSNMSSSAEKYAKKNRIPYSVLKKVYAAR